MTALVTSAASRRGPRVAGSAGGQTRFLRARPTFPQGPRSRSGLHGQPAACCARSGLQAQPAGAWASPRAEASLTGLGNWSNGSGPRPPGPGPAFVFGLFCFLFLCRVFVPSLCNSEDVKVGSARQPRRLCVLACSLARDKDFL